MADRNQELEKKNLNMQMLRWEVQLTEGVRVLVGKENDQTAWPSKH